MRDNDSGARVQLLDRRTYGSAPDPADESSGFESFARDRGTLASAATARDGYSDPLPAEDVDLVRLLAIEPAERIDLGWHVHAPEAPGPARAEEGLAEEDADSDHGPDDREAVVYLLARDEGAEVPIAEPVQAPAAALAAT